MPRVSPVAFSITVFLLHGCATYQVTAPEPNRAGQLHQKTAVVWGWGIWEDKPVAAECDVTNALADVRTRSTFGYGVVTILTLGLVRPMKVEYYCDVGESQHNSFGDD